MRMILGLLCASTIAFTPLAVLAETITPKAQSTEAIELGTRYTLHSNILGEDREILVRLPEGYGEGDAHYPVVYVTDAELHFSYFALMAGALEEHGRMPESIFVGITNFDGGDGTRNRDLLYEEGSFRGYLTEEVFPFIDGNFRTTNLRTLFGGSLGGYFALNILADQMDLFDNYIGASPATYVDLEGLLKKLDILFDSGVSVSKSLYYTMTENGEEGPGITDALNKVTKKFKDRAPKELDWKYEFIRREVHMTTPIPTMFAGLSHVFRDFQAPTFNSIEEYESAGGMKGLEAHFAARASKYGASTVLPVNLLLALGQTYTTEGKYTKANDLFSEAVKLYPEHRNAFGRLGGSYMDLEMHEEALKAYNRALALTDPQNSGTINYYKARIAAVEAKLAE